eukprot:m.270785 g.270785  ORF g.270785 m.270785 type:complete len:912 (+) comp19743_c0_seq1:101-2836(+)
MGVDGGGFRLVALALAASLIAVGAVDRNNFKTCDQSNFCKRNRNMEPHQSKYAINVASIRPSSTAVSMDVVNTGTSVEYTLQITSLKDLSVRVQMNEKNPKAPRHTVKDVLPETLPEANLAVKERDENKIVLAMADQVTVVVHYQPLRIDVFSKDDLVLSLNSRGLLEIEHQREKQEGDPEGMWTEDWKTHVDTKPKGPTAVSFDATFHGVENVYGIPEHATKLSLPNTKPDTEPYRLFNLDVFEYELDNPMALYGSIPFMIGHRAQQTTGLFFLNSAEMWVDVEKSHTNSGFTNMLRRLQEVVMGPTGAGDVPTTNTHWIAESGVLDVFVMVGPKPADVFRQYAALTGLPSMPPLFAIAYHQCRWNYNDENDVLEVSEKLDDAGIPTDVIWLDIEHTDGKRYMTWNKDKFPNPKEMQHTIAKKGRKMVNIVDPHIKRVGGYKVHEEAQSLGYYIKNKDGNEYDGWCWPGSSSWLDFMNPDIRSWWADQFAFDKYEGTTEHMYFWNDMNEMSVFNGPEVTIHKDAQHFEGWENRDVHNIYGMWQQAATAEGIVRRSGGVERPFVLSRAFFSGSQKYGAIWTGDNKGDWSHLEASVPMILSISVAGLPFAGADMGGFFGNPDNELLARWYQAGAFQPFMRAHAHLDTKRREPYLLEGDYFDVAKQAVLTRYSYLPFWYTLFYETSLSGMPIMRPLWVEFPTEMATFGLEDAFMVGSDLLVKPVTSPDTTSVDCYFPGSEPWYDVLSGLKHTPGDTKTLAAPLRKIPVFQRGGSIIPRKMRPRRASAMMHRDPFTLDVALDSNQSAQGTLFIDDYHTFSYEKDGKMAYASMKFGPTGANTYVFTFDVSVGAGFTTVEWVERINIAGFSGDVIAAVDHNGAALGVTFDTTSQTLTLKKPLASVLTQGSITITTA